MVDKLRFARCTAFAHQPSLGRFNYIVQYKHTAKLLYVPSRLHFSTAEHFQHTIQNELKKVKNSDFSVHVQKMKQNKRINAEVGRELVNSLNERYTEMTAENVIFTLKFLSEFPFMG